MAQEHKHGAMDTEVQEKTFAGFINWTTKTVITVSYTHLTLPTKA